MATFWRPAKFVRIGGMVVAGLLVLFALAVSLIRSLLPQLDQARDQVTEYLWDNYRLKVQVAELSAEWQAFGPALTVTGLVLPEQEGLPLSLAIARTQIKLDFWRTLRDRAPSVENVVFDGVVAELNLDAMAASSAKPASKSSVNDKPMGVDWLYRLLLEQLRQFAMSEVKVAFNSQAHQYRPVYVGDLRWFNTEGRHRAEGYVFLNQDAPLSERLQLLVDLKGNGNDPASIAGQFYLKADGLDVGDWAAKRSSAAANQTPMPVSGVVNFQLWGSLAERELSSVLLSLGPSYLEWPAEAGSQQLEVEDGQVLWQQEGSGWSLGSEDLKLNSNGNPWPQLWFAARYDGNNMHGVVSQLDLTALMPLVPLIPGLDNHKLADVFAAAPRGMLTDIRLGWTERPSRGVPLSVLEAFDSKTVSGFDASARVTGLEWRALDAIPGLSPVNARLYTTEKDLRVSLDAQQFSVDFGDEFKAPLRFSTPGIELGFGYRDSTLISPAVKLANEDVSLDASLKLLLGTEPALELGATVSVFDAARAGAYFPRLAMGEELADYLEQALQAGRIEDGRVLWRGKLADFPYQDGSGVFQAGFVLTDGQFAFQPDWPAIKELNLTALFENARMDLWVDKGFLKAVDATGAYVHIPEMSEQTVLKVEAALATTGPAATSVLKQSPLADSVGKVLDVVQVQGNVKGDLDLTIPLYEEAEADIRGLVLFDDTPVYFATPGVQMTRLKGELSFRNDAIEARELSGRLFGQPTDFDLTGSSTDKGYRVRSSLKGGWDLASLPASLDNPLSPFYQGVLAWQARMQLDLPDDSDFILTTEAQSSLRNLALSLPAPYRKPQGEPMPLKVALNGTQKGLDLNVTLAQLGAFNARIDPESGKMQDFLLRLADGSQPLLSQAQAQAPAADLASAAPAGTVPASAVPASAAPKDASQVDVSSAPSSPAPPSSPDSPTTQAQPPEQAQVQARRGVMEVALKQADFSQWLELIERFASQNTGAAGGETGDNAGAAARNEGEGKLDDSFFPPLEDIRVSLGSLDIFGQTLVEPKIHARPEQGLWRISTESAAFAGDVDIMPDWHRQGIQIRASRLDFAPELEDEKAKAEGVQAKAAAETASNASGAQTASAALVQPQRQSSKAESKAELRPESQKQEPEQAATEPANFPPLQVTVADFSLYGRKLGQLTLKGQPLERSYRFETVNLQSNAATFKGEGEWLGAGDAGQTRLKFELKAAEFEALSKQLNLDLGIKHSPLDLSGALYWKGAPQDFALASLNGEVKFRLGKGSLSEVSDKGARIFSLFSLDSLLRKLSLDFSDVFGKGLYYNSFTGTLTLDDGVVKTRDTQIDAIAGDMKVRGYTDLSTRSLNYDIRFVPQLASSVPTVVLLSTSAWTLGIGAFALTKVLEPVIEVISEIRFRLTGTMSDPVLEELERKSKEIEIPESVLPKKQQADGDKGKAPAPLKQDAPVKQQDAPVKQQGAPVPPLTPPPAGQSEQQPPQSTAESQLPLPAQPAGQAISSKTDVPATGVLLPFCAPIQWNDNLEGGEPDAGQFAAMPEQSRRRGESCLYTIAA